MLRFPNTIAALSKIGNLIYNAHTHLDFTYCRLALETNSKNPSNERALTRYFDFEEGIIRKYGVR